MGASPVVEEQHYDHSRAVAWTVEVGARSEDVISPGVIENRADFHDAIGRLIRRPEIARDRREESGREAERRGFVVRECARATAYSWAKSSIPQKSGGPFIGLLLSRGVPVDELVLWVDALERARVAGYPESPSAEQPGKEAPPAIEPAEGPTPGPERARRRRMLVGVVSVVALVVLGSVVWVTVAGAGDPSVASPRPATVEEPLLREDFDGGQLDPARWLPPSDPSHVYPADRVLNMTGSTPGAPAETDVDLIPRDVGSFREIDFVASVPSFEVAGTGGASLVVSEQNGRTHELVFGPSPGRSPSSLAAALICSRPTCRSYDDYDTPPPTRPFERFAGDEVVPLRVVQNDGLLTFWVHDTLMAQAPVAQPLRAFRFNDYASPEERWHITIDALRVYR